MRGERKGLIEVQAFKKRAAEIADHARNARGGTSSGEGGEFLRGLDEWERGCKCFPSLYTCLIEGQRRGRWMANFYVF